MVSHFIKVCNNKNKSQTLLANRNNRLSIIKKKSNVQGTLVHKISYNPSLGNLSVYAKYAWGDEYFYCQYNVRDWLLVSLSPHYIKIQNKNNGNVTSFRTQTKINFTML